MEAVLFQPGGTVVVLPGLGSASPFDAAYGINQGGLIVGTAETSSRCAHAFLYNNATGTQDLNGRLVTDGSTPVDLQNADGITDSGYITGTGTSAAGATHAYLLTPVMQGDANEDGGVDVNDLTIVLTDFDRSVGANGWTLGDFNGAGKVDINDLTIVLASFGQSLGTLAAGTAHCAGTGRGKCSPLGRRIGLLGCGSARRGRRLAGSRAGRRTPLSRAGHVAVAKEQQKRMPHRLKVFLVADKPVIRATGLALQIGLGSRSWCSAGRPRMPPRPASGFPPLLPTW